MVRFAGTVDCGTVSAFAAMEQPTAKTKFFAVHNVSLEVTKELDDPEYNRRDPVLQHCRNSNVPIVWNRDTFVAEGLVDRWEVQAKHGFHSGIALALHLPRGRHFFLSIDRDQSFPANEIVLARMVADLQLFAAFSVDAALRILVPSISPADGGPLLTPRELECLRWTSEGKTAWEVGCILAISEQTAVRHLNNAARKLECVNKHHAAIKALRLGLIL